MRARRLLCLAVPFSLFAFAAAPAAQTAADTLGASADAPPEEAPAPRPTPRPRPRPTARAVGTSRLSGPRIGVTLLSPAVVREINDRLGNCVDYDPQTGVCRNETIISPATPFITQFGWQFERQMAQTSGGLAIVTESVILLGGLERGLALPSATFVVGVRTLKGFELGLGPNLSATGAGYALTAGVANDIGEIHVPVNVAAVFGREGPRVSVLVGLTFSDARY